MTVFYLRYRTRIYRYAIQQGHSDYDADVIANETIDEFATSFIRFLKNEEPDLSLGLFESYLFGIAKNKCLRQHKRLKFLREKHGLEEGNDDDGDVFANLVDASVDIEASIADKQTHKSLNDCIEALKPKLREVVRLVYWGGYGQEEVADRVGVPVGTIKSRLFTAKAKLEVCMSKCKKIGARDGR